MVLTTVEAISSLHLSLAVKTGTTVVFLALLILALFSPIHALCTSPGRSLGWLLPLIAGSTIVWALLFLAGALARFDYRVTHYDLLWVGALSAGLPIAAWVLTGRHLTRRRQLVLLVLCWLAFSLAWIVPLRHFPIDGERSDMLPAIVLTVRVWLSGQPPYQSYDIGLHRAPLPYLPMMWLSYAPALLLKLDPRWMAVPAQLGFLLVLWAGFRPHLSRTWWPYVLWMALNPFLFIRQDIHVYVLWPFLAVALLCMVRRQWLLASVFWGLLLAFRKTLWVPFPFFAAFLLWETGWRNALRCVLVSAGVFLVLVAPFVLDSPAQFLDGVLGYPRSVIQHMPDASWQTVAGWTTGFSLVPLVYLAGGSSLLELAQVVVVLAIFVVTVVRRPDLARTLQMMSLALLLFLLLNPLIEVYMYAPLLIIAGFTALARQDALPLLISPPAGRTKSSSPG